LSPGGSSLTELISQHVIALVFTSFLLLLGTVVLILVIGRLFWKRRSVVWSLVAKGVSRIGRIGIVVRVRKRFPGVFGFLGRLTPQAFLEIYLLAGLLVSVGIVFFAALAEEITEKSSLVAFDHQLAAALQNTWTPRFVLAFSRVTALGGGYSLAVIAVGVALILFLRKERSLLIGWIVATLGASVLTTVLKAIFQRMRPEYAHMSTWSFPSGHSMGSFVTYGMLTYILSRYLPSWAAGIIGAGLLLLVLFIGFSRLYLGVHFFSDVIAGYSVAMVWLAVCISGTQIARHREKARRPA
jgi:undecaprenyl-diphosphatase